MKPDLKDMKTTASCMQCGKSYTRPLVVKDFKSKWPMEMFCTMECYFEFIYPKIPDRIKLKERLVF